MTVGSGSVTACTPAFACASDGEGGYTLALNTANISGSLKDQDAATVQYSFVDVMVDDDGQSNTGENGYESFVTWADVDELGAFSLYLDAGTDGAARNYQLAAFPSWSDTTHQRTLVTVEVSGNPAAVTNCTKATSGDCISNGSLAVSLSKGNYFGTIKSSTGDNLANALVMLVNDSGTVITDSLTNSSGVYYLNLTTQQVSDNSCGTENQCDLKVQPASLAVGSAVDQTTTFNDLGILSSPGSPVSLGSKTLSAAS